MRDQLALLPSQVFFASIFSCLDQFFAEVNYVA